MPEAAEIWRRRWVGRLHSRRRQSNQVRQYSEDTALMLQCSSASATAPTSLGLEREFGRALTKLPDWAAPLKPNEIIQIQEKNMVVERLKQSSVT